MHCTAHMAHAQELECIRDVDDDRVALRLHLSPLAGSSLARWRHHLQTCHRLVEEEHMSACCSPCALASRRCRLLRRPRAFAGGTSCTASTLALAHRKHVEGQMGFCRVTRAQRRRPATAATGSHRGRAESRPRSQPNAAARSAGVKGERAPA